MREWGLLVTVVVAEVLLGIVVSYSGLFAPLVLTTTRYGPGFSEKKFRAITKGRREEQVRSTLGNPLAEFDGPPLGYPVAEFDRNRERTLIYSFAGDPLPIPYPTYFRSRIIILSNGVVTKKWSFINDDRGCVCSLSD